MFEKRSFCGIDEFEPVEAAEGENLMILEDGRVLVISNAQDSFYILFYSAEGSFIRKMSFDRQFGRLVGIRLLNGALWVEFHEHIAVFEEIYKVVRIDADYNSTLVFSAPRESYNHSLVYHGLFRDEYGVFCNIIRHNRIHQYRLRDAPDNAEEVNIQEGGKWFISESFPLCILGGTLEIYDPQLTFLNSLDFDYEIDELFLGVSDNPAFLALLTVDHSQGDAFLIVHTYDTGICAASFIGNAVSAVGVSAGRIWVNPASFDQEQDLGGLAVYNSFAQPIYIHIRNRAANSGFGAFPPPFHRCYKIIPIADGATLIVKANKALLFDYAGRAIQEIPIAHPELIAVSQDGGSLAVLHAKNPHQPDNSNKEAVIDFYTFNSSYEGDKVVDIARFRERES
ncbi:MAG: hypothetical protein LBP51_01425 [Deferribacteraceae bacterium]|jgi:hypothetical protein|nr:hypothetical protein [Deferribacteraceae bacterium]